MSGPTVQVVVMSADELEALLERAVSRALAKAAEASKPAEYITLAEASGLLRNTERHTRRLIAAGRIRATKNGRKVLVLAASIEMYLAENAR